MEVADEFAAAAGTDSDLGYAFQLQMQEAIRASLTSKPSSSSSKDEVFTVYFKGLVRDKTVSNIKMSFAGIGVAIYDESDWCLYEKGKSSLLEAGGGRGTESDRVELEALIEAMNVAVNRGLKRVKILCDCNSVYQYLGVYVEQNYNKLVYKLARNAIKHETTKWDTDDDDSGVTITEQCTICFEYFESGKLLSVNECLHRYCFSCMSKHAEAQLLQGKLPECPHEKCESKIGSENCKKLLNPELYKIMTSLVKEASIPLTDKIYCPFSNCSALMSKAEVQEHTPTSSSTAAGETGMRRCVECDRHFCINCKVPWHENVTCSDYLNSHQFMSSNEAKLNSLATKNRWRECIKCKNLVELWTGCYHIYCRCGHEFCYTCGAEWINKRATCRCPLWDERKILYQQRHQRYR